MVDKKLDKPIGQLTTKWQVYAWCVGSLIVIDHAFQVLCNISIVGVTITCFWELLSVSL